MAISIEPCRTEDAERMILCGEAAFANDVLANRIFDRKTATAEQLAEFRGWRVTTSKKRMNGAGKHYFKAVDVANGKIVGYIGMYSPGIDVMAQSSTPRPGCVNSEVEDELKAKLHAVHEIWIGDRKDVWFVQTMCVHPDYQGKGIAKRLLQRGLEEVDKAGQDIFLEATHAASRLYESCGFEVVDEILFLDGQYRLGLMIRHPKPVSAIHKD